MRQNIKIGCHDRIIRTRMILAVVFTFVCIFIFSCRKIESINNSIVSKQEMPKSIELIKKTNNSSEAPLKDYYCTVLDDGILELKEYTDKESYFTGHIQTWEYSIIGEGTVRLLWECEQSGAIVDRYTEIYTINTDGSYTMEKDYMLDGIKYLLIGENSPESVFLKGYYIDLNGKKYFYSIDKNCLVDDSFDSLLEYLLSHKDQAKETTTMSQTEFYDSFKYLNKYENDSGAQNYEIGTMSNLYFTKIVTYHCDIISCEFIWIASKTGDKISCRGDEVLSVIDVLGSDWYQCD